MREKRTSNVLGIFDAESIPHPPSSAAQTVPSVSPLVAVIQEIRRTHLAAAAASVTYTSAPYSIREDDLVDADGLVAYNEPRQDDGMVPLTDPLEQQAHASHFCQCSSSSSRRHSSWAVPSGVVDHHQRSPTAADSPAKEPPYQRERRELSMDIPPNVCSNCGKPKPSPAMNGDAGGISWHGYHGHQHYYGSSGKLILRHHAFHDGTTEEPKHAKALLQATPQLRFLHNSDMDGQDSSLSIWEQLLPHNDEDRLRHPQDEYRASVQHQMAHEQAASNLASLMWTLAHEMSLEKYGTVETQVFSAVFAMVHDTQDRQRRLAGLAALDALLGAPSADEEKKAIKFANTLSTGLRMAKGDYDVLVATTSALGQMARRTVDFVESEVTRSLEWLRSERSDRRLAASLTLTRFAKNAPTTFHSKTTRSSISSVNTGSNEFLDFIFIAIFDAQPMVRACGADALTCCLKILAERRHASLTGHLCQVYFKVLEGFHEDTTKKKKHAWLAQAQTEASRHGSLLAVGTMLVTTGDFMLPRYDEICREVMASRSHAKALIRLEVVRLIPRLARRHPRIFGRRYLEDALLFVLDMASSPTPPRVKVDLRPASYHALGELVLAMLDRATGHIIGGREFPTLKIVADPGDPDGLPQAFLSRRHVISEELDTMFALIRKGLGASSRGLAAVSATQTTVGPALYCATHLVEVLGEDALPYMDDLIDEMFRAGLSNDLIQCLYTISQCVVSQRSHIEDRLLQEVSFCLAGVRDVFVPLATYCTASMQRLEVDLFDLSPPLIFTSNENDIDSVRSLVLSLQTLASFGGANGNVTTSGRIVPLLPFVQSVVAAYFIHPSSEVRRAATVTACAVLLSHGTSSHITSAGYSGMIVEEVLSGLLRVAVSDVAANVRLCVIRALDSRYDIFLRQTHHLRELFMVLEDEVVATRSAALQLLGRLSYLNPAAILPFLRRLLMDLTVELRCEVETGRGREEAIRLVIVFLRARSLQRLVMPILPSLVSSLPIDGSAPPRLTSISLEALGELAQCTGTALRPWTDKVLPHILAIMQDQSSASKQRTSLRTLGQIASAAGYVISPYFDYPNLLAQATDILPATKRAPWALRREVIRTLGILGALDPERYQHASSQNRKSGVAGGAYFEENGTTEAVAQNSEKRTTFRPRQRAKQRFFAAQSVRSNAASAGKVESPAYLVMYEQYAMAAQPVSNLQPVKRLSLLDEDFFQMVSVQALMRVFRDSGLAVHHGMVIQAIMFIFKSLGVHCVPLLPKVVPDTIVMVRVCPTALRESLLLQLSSLGQIVREHLRPYVADVFNIVESFWETRHLETICNVVTTIATGVADEFQKFAPRFIRRLLGSIDGIHIADWSVSSLSIPNSREALESQKLKLLMRSMRDLKSVLGEYLHILVPTLLNVANSLAVLENTASQRRPVDALNDLQTLSFATVSALLESQLPIGHVRLITSVYPDGSGSSEAGLASRVVQPVLRIFDELPPSNPAVAMAMIDSLCAAASMIGKYNWLKLYDETVRLSIAGWQATRMPRKSLETSSSTVLVDERVAQCYAKYANAIEELGRLAVNRSRLYGSREIDVAPAVAGVSHVDDVENNDSSLAGVHANAISRPRVNQTFLQRAWDVSQRSSRDDWDEWMRGFTIQLLREAPSQSLRATASLAQAYQPLARELFCAAFYSCWKDLSQTYRADLVQSLQTAFAANVSPEILQALLNLAEFMEQDPSGGLPIDIAVLADLALKCRAYAKALTYKEREYRLRPSNSCVEALISINRKLDLQEAALGILKASALVSDTSMRQETMKKFSRHQQYEMRYSVVKPGGIVESLSRDQSPREELWLAKLGSWSEALALYEDKLKRDPADFDALLGCMRCLDGSGDWRKVLELSEISWSPIEVKTDENNERNDAGFKARRSATRLCAHAAWRLGQWDTLEQCTEQLLRGSEKEISQASSIDSARRRRFNAQLDFDGAFYTSVLHIHRNEWTKAASTIDLARRAMDGRLTALMSESYSRAYPSMVTAQTLAELEEIIDYKKLQERWDMTESAHPVNRPDHIEARNVLLGKWRRRLEGCRPDAEVHASILAVRSLILGPEDEVESTLRLSELSRQAQRLKFAERVLLDPLGSMVSDLDSHRFGHGLSEQLAFRPDFSQMSAISLQAKIESVLFDEMSEPSYGPLHHQWSNRIVKEAGGLEKLQIQQKLYFAYTRHLWHTDQRPEAMTRLSELCDAIDLVSHCHGGIEPSLRVSCWLDLGEWKLSNEASPKKEISNALQADALSIYKRAIKIEGCGYKAWHSWALLNFRIGMQYAEDEKDSKNRHHARRLSSHIQAAVRGFVLAVGLGTENWSASVQQDLLNLLTCLFKYGDIPQVGAVLEENLSKVAVEAWLGVLPQMLARIHMREPATRRILHSLLQRVGEAHPQAVIYPLSVLLKSPVSERKIAAEALMDSLKAHSSQLVDQALMVSSELIRVAILWVEAWNFGLDEGSQLFFQRRNFAEGLEVLKTLHESISRGAATKREKAFLAAFGNDLQTAYMHIQEFERLMREAGLPIPTQYDWSFDRVSAEVNKAWDIYYVVYRQTNRQLSGLTKLELDDCSPALSRARDLELGIPGTYRVDGSYVRIEKFIPSVQVITSKQRPRKITLRGSDGMNYVFLLKAHEDLRQDERVMQLFGLVNALLVRDPQTKQHDLKIQRYAISPLSHDCGIVGWVPHCDTLHSLIKDYRSTKKVPLNMEHREMVNIAADYDLLTTMQKVEVFMEALGRTTGQGNDLAEILWLKSSTSEEWLERRTTYTRSLAVMSVVGFLLGLGDRHPSNLMLDKLSGRILHIDFGDCFEVAMNRDKYPEKIPFRLTRMLIKAMEVSGIEGSYRSTCERTMTVLRDNRESLITMLEAFVYDPLISWRLSDLSPGRSHIGGATPPSDDRGDMDSRASERLMQATITEGHDEDTDNDDDHGVLDTALTPSRSQRVRHAIRGERSSSMAASAARARSLQLYNDFQRVAAGTAADSRVASIAGDSRSAVDVMGRSRMERSQQRQRELSMLLSGEAGSAQEEALNEKAVKVIRRVQDKLNGTDFVSDDSVWEDEPEPQDVNDQVARLIVEATSVENLCQLYIGWCADDIEVRSFAHPCRITYKTTISFIESQKSWSSWPAT